MKKHSIINIFLLISTCLSATAKDQETLARASILQTDIAPFIQSEDCSQQLQSSHDVIVTVESQLDAAELEIQSLIDACSSCGDSLCDSLLEETRTQLSETEELLDTTRSQLSCTEEALDMIELCCYTTSSKLDLLVEQTSDIESKVDLLSSDKQLVFGPNDPTINLPGSYILANNIDGALTIESNNVTLDLNNYRIKGDTGLGYGILIDGKKHIEIYNGTIGPDTAGELAAGILATNNTGLQIHDCNLINNQYGLNTQNSTNVVVEDCRSQFFTNYGFYLNGCENSLLQGCYALTSTISNQAVGFKSENGFIDTFEKCQARDLIADDTASGFWLVDSNNCFIKKCLVDTINSNTSAYGIYMEFIPIVPLPGNTVNISNDPTQMSEISNTTFDGSNNAIAVWTEAISSTTNNVYARRYDASTYQWDASATNISNDQEQSASIYFDNISADTAGNALAIWQEKNLSTGKDNVYARRYDATLDWALTATNISHDQNQDINFPSITMNPTGDALAIWIENNSVTGVKNTYARGYSATTQQWDLTTTNISFDQDKEAAMFPKIGIDAAGNTIAAWIEVDPLASNNLYARRYDKLTNNWEPATLLFTSTFNFISLSVNSLGDALISFDDNFTSILAQFYNASTNSWDPTPTTLYSASSPGEQCYTRSVDLNNSTDGIAVWTSLNSSTYDRAFAVPFNGSTQTWTLPALDISSTYTSESPYLGILASIDDVGNITTAWTNRSNGVFNVISRRYNHLTDAWETPNILSTNNGLIYYYTLSLEIDSTGTSLTTWSETNFSEIDTPQNVYANISSTPPPAPEQSSNCLITDNIVTNVTDEESDGIGIEGYSEKNTFIKNIVSYCDTSYGTNISNVQSGFTGSNTMYNVSLPT